MFVIGRLTEGGFLQVSCDNVVWAVVHDAKVPDHIKLKHYTSIRKAKAEIPPHPDAIIMRVSNKEVQKVWFTKSQMNRGFYQRLQRFGGCYGTIKVSELNRFS